MHGVARGGASRQRLQPVPIPRACTGDATVARGGASRQRLQLFTSSRTSCTISFGRKGWGFSPEIATEHNGAQYWLSCMSQGVGHLARDCNFARPAREALQKAVARGGASRQRLQLARPDFYTSNPATSQGVGLLARDCNDARSAQFNARRVVARGGASRQRLQLCAPGARGSPESGRKGWGISPEIATAIDEGEIERLAAVAKGWASRQRLQDIHAEDAHSASSVARGGASRQRLQALAHIPVMPRTYGRKGWGFSPEIASQECMSFKNG